MSKGPVVADVKIGVEAAPEAGSALVGTTGVPGPGGGTDVEEPPAACRVPSEGIPGASALMATPVGVLAAVLGVVVLGVAVLGLVRSIPGVAEAVLEMGVSVEAVSGVAARTPRAGAAASGADGEGA